MSGRGGRADRRIERTVAYLLRCPRSTVPEVMRASKFSLAESSDLAKQMAVRWAYQKASSSNTKPPPPKSIQDVYSWDINHVPPDEFAAAGGLITSIDADKESRRVAVVEVEVEAEADKEELAGNAKKLD
jgi:hypothetical protein